MTAAQWSTEQFEQNRTHLTAVALRMLGSFDEAQDAVQEAWLRVNRSDVEAVENMRAWLTTVVSRICLDMLRSRAARREELTGELLAEMTSGRESADPQEEVLIADSVGLALLVLLETLSPAERLAFVLHDMFGMPFEEIAPIVDRNVEATRQLASRARRRIRRAEARPETSSASIQQPVVDAFLAASRKGDFAQLLDVLDPEVVFCADRGRDGEPGTERITGRDAVAAAVLERGSPFVRLAEQALIDGRPALVIRGPRGLVAASRFTIRDGRVTEIDVTSLPDTLARLQI
jgi:RNA polymerase sigma-70 factor (ECF subfamily)